MSNADGMIRPVEENLLYWVNTVRTADLEWVMESRDLGVPAIVSDIPFPQFNMVTGAAPEDGDWAGMTHRVASYFIERGLPWMWWTTPSYTTPEMEAILAECALSADDAPGMYVDLTGLPAREDTDLEIVHVSADDEEFADVLLAGFGIPDFVRQPMREFLSVLDSEDIELLIRSHGEAVGVGTGLVTGETLGIYNIATLPEARGQGVGRLVTAELMREGARLGCTHAILHTSPMGRPVYERLGFREVCPTTQWVWMPPIE